MKMIVTILIRKGLTALAVLISAHGWLSTDDSNKFTSYLATLALLAVSYIWEHLHLTKVSNPIQSPKAISLSMLAGLLVPALLLSAGCTMTREKTTINTPAVYNVTKDASGALQTNLVSAASVTTQIHKERMWLPDGYNLTLEQDVFGINVTPLDPSSTSAKVQAGVVSTRARWTPTATNNLFSPPITDQVDVDNKAIPFWLRASGQFTSGQVSSSQSDTNATSEAIIPK